MIIDKKKYPNTHASFTLKNRILRFIWYIVQESLFRFSPRPFHLFRIMILKLFGADIKWTNYIYNNVKIWAPWNLKIGYNNGIANGVILYNMEKILLGNNITISQGAHLCTGTHDYTSKNFQLYAKKIIIENHVWICAETFVHPNVKINQGVVVGARSVVTKNLESDWSVYSGNPCKYIKKRILSN